jgi:hypothetical protein
MVLKFNEKFRLIFCKEDTDMIQEKTLEDSNTVTRPIVQNSRVIDPLIRLREMMLNGLSGVGQSTVINSKEPPDEHFPAADLAADLKKTLTNLKIAAMSENGASVNYAAIRDSKTYIEYRQECLAALRLCDPQGFQSLEAARTFWINLYNTLVLDAVIYFRIQQSVTEGLLGIFTFFRRTAYLVGGHRVSLEDMEHGILRGNRGNPYMPGVHFSSNDPRLAWSLPLDPRIHFALNCGGRSCPPIRAYEIKKLNQQLDLATRGFVDQTVEVDPERNEVFLSQIFRWYAADFGGRKGIIQLLIDYLPKGERRQALLSAWKNIRFKYQSYDWGLNDL